MRAVRKAGIALLDYEYVTRHQLRARFDRTSPEALVSDGALGPVVLLAGIFESWRFLRPLARHIHDRGHPVHVIDALGRNLVPVDECARIVADYLEARDLTDVSIVAHSKGGLVAKYVLGMPGASERVRHVVAICTPFSGSSLARYVPLRSVRSLMPSDEGMRRLTEARDMNARFVSVASSFDPHIPNGSHLDGARNVRLAVGGHFRVLASAELLDLVDRCLEER